MNTTARRYPRTVQEAFPNDKAAYACALERRDPRLAPLPWPWLLGALVLLYLIAVSGCTRAQDYAVADNAVLCDPVTGQAFFVEPNAGDTSFVKRMPGADWHCKRATK